MHYTHSQPIVADAVSSGDERGGFSAVLNTSPCVVYGCIYMSECVCGGQRTKVKIYRAAVSGGGRVGR